MSASKLRSSALLSGVAGDCAAKAALMQRPTAASNIMMRVELIFGFSRLLRLGLVAGAFDQFYGFGVREAGRGQIAVDEDRVDRGNQITLTRADVQLAAAGGAHLAARIEQAEQARDLETSLGSEFVLAVERSAFDRMEKIHRHRIDLKCARRVGEIE